MKKFLQTFLLFALFITGFGIKKAQATHVMGMDVQWKCLGNDTYQITITAYRRCTDGAAQMSAVNPVITSDSCSNSYNVSSGSYKSWTIEDITPVCNASYKPCTTPNGNGGSSTPQIPVGVEKHTFIYKVYLGGAYANCCWYRIQWQLCCRNSNISTGYADQNFLSESWLNRCATPCDNGPEFKNPPVAVKCAGQDVCFNHGVIDVDGDSLSYRMAPPLTTSGGSSIYTSPWSPTYPLTCLGGNNPNPNANPPTGFNLDPLTGDMCFRPMQVQITVLKVEVTEWRKINGVYKVIGKTYRDMQFIIVANCNNKLPTLSGPFSYEACAGQQICIIISTNDQDFADTTRIFWNKGIPNGTWSTTNGIDKRAKGTMCWTPDESDASTLPYYFTATVQDDHCPLNGSTTRSYAITVKPTPKNTRQFIKKGCGLWNFEATPVSNYFNGASYKWYVPKAIGTGSPNTLYSQSQNTSYQFTQGGTYVVRSTMTFNGCSNTYYDTLLVDTPIQVVCMPDTFVCSGKPITLSCTVSHYYAPLRYKWSTSPNDTQATVTINPTTPGYYRVIVTDRDTCSAMDSVFVDIKALPTVNVGPDVRLCYGDSFQLDAGNPGAFYLWKKDGAFFASTQTIYVRDSAQYTLMVVDSYSCEGYDTFNLFVNPPVIVGPLTDQTICSGDTTWLHASGADTYEWRNNQNTQVLSGDSIEVIPSVTTTFYVKGTKTVMGKTCYGFDTVVVSVNALPVISFPAFPKRCINGGLINLSAMLKVNNIPVPALAETWYCTKLPNSVDPVNFTFDPTAAAPLGGMFWVTYEATATNGCKGKDSVLLEVVPPPYVSAGTDKLFCVNYNGTWNLDTMSVPFGGSWTVISNNHTTYPLDSTPSFGGKYSYNFSPSNAGDGATHLGATHRLVYTYKDIFPPRCENYDTVDFVVNPIPHADAGIDTAVCVGVGQFNLTNALHANSVTGTWYGPGVLSDSVTFNPGINQTAFPQTYTVYFYIWYNGGCSDLDSAQITVNPIPLVTLSASRYGVCKTDAPIILTGTPAGPGGKYYLDGNLLAGPSVDPTVIDTGNHIVKFSYTNPVTGCSKDTTLTIYVELPPKVSIDPLPGICERTSQDSGIIITGHTYAPYGFRWVNLGGGTLKNSNWTDSVITYVPSATEVAAQKYSIAIVSTGNTLCGPDSFYAEAPIYPTPIVNFYTPKDAGCVPFTADFIDSSIVSGGASYYWDFGDPASGARNNDTNAITSHRYDSVGIYTIRLVVKSKEGCEQTFIRNKYVEAYPIPKADFYFTPDSFNWATVALPKYKFQDLSTCPPYGIKSWEWDFGDGQGKSTQQNPEYGYKVLNPEKDTGYFYVTLKVVSNKGDCYDEITRRIYIGPDLTVFIPNAFSPDDNGVPTNEKFRVVATGIKTFEMWVFNRWGEKMYYSNDYATHGWDGFFNSKESQEDVYVYKVIVSALSGKKYEFNGTVHLIR